MGRIPRSLPRGSLHKPCQHGLHGPVGHAFHQAPADPLPEAAALGECCQPGHQHTQDLLCGKANRAMGHPVSAARRPTGCIAKPPPRSPGQLASAHPQPGPGKARQGDRCCFRTHSNVPPSARETRAPLPCCPRTATRRKGEGARTRCGFSPDRKHSLCLPWTQAFPTT